MEQLFGKLVSAKVVPVLHIMGLNTKSKYSKHLSPIPIEAVEHSKSKHLRGSWPQLWQLFAASAETLQSSEVPGQESILRNYDLDAKG